MTTNTTNRPSHFVYAVRKGANGNKGFWTRIGAAWTNHDGEGLSVKLDLIPLDGADIVIRTPREEREGTEA